ncbi:MAG: hypothetical protein HF973_03870 [Chloroflexi bacterium]|nr:hypothetical protein [Chloroflexota bacterium]
MRKQHRLTISPQKYPGGIRFIECQECSYAAAAVVDEHGYIQPGSKMKINSGNTQAAHAYSPGRLD